MINRSVSVPAETDKDGQKVDKSMERTVSLLKFGTDSEGKEDFADCVICCQRLPKFIFFPFCSKCTEEVCRKCVLEYVLEDLGQLCCAEFECPNCESSVELYTVRKCLEEASRCHRIEQFLQVLDRHSVRKALGAEPKVVYCPGDGCDYAVVVEKGTCFAPIPCGKCGAEVMCTRGGDGEVKCCGEPMQQK